jgi:hypothetical protein
MRAFSLVRSLVIVTLVAIAVAAPLGMQPATAQTTTLGSVMIHSRICPTTATQLFRDCHPNPGPAGWMYTIDKRVPKTINSVGNVSFGSVRPGDWLVTIVSGKPSAYSNIRAFCSNSVGGSGVHEATILWSKTPQFWVRVGSGSKLTCDVYFIP